MKRSRSSLTDNCTCALLNSFQARSNDGPRRLQNRHIHTCQSHVSHFVLLLPNALNCRLYMAASASLRNTRTSVGLQELGDKKKRKGQSENMKKGFPGAQVTKWRRIVSPITLAHSFYSFDKSRDFEQLPLRPPFPRPRRRMSGV